MSSDSSESSKEQRTTRELELQQVQNALQGLRFGSVNIIVQDGVVVQIDRTEKHRLRGTDESVKRRVSRSTE